MRLEKITRNKNEYTFHFHNGNVVIDLDKKGQPLVGVSGKTLKNRPHNVDETRIGRMILDEYCLNGTYYFSTYREIIDRLISLEINPARMNRLVGSFYRTDIEEVLEKKNWKKFVKILKETGLDDSHNILKRIKTDEIISKFNLAEKEKKAIQEFCKKSNKDIIDFNEDIIFLIRKELEKEKGFRKEIENIEKYISNVPAELKELLDIRYEKNFDSYTIIAKVFQKYFIYNELLKKWNLPKESGDFNKKYERILKIDKEYSTMTPENMFEKSQKAYALAYENDKVIVTVPTTRKECIDIGNEFRNCVGGYEWNCYLSKGDRKLVIITLKETNEKVCCDINNDGKILQYLKECNTSVRNETLLEFKKIYQNYLDSIFNA